MNNKDLIRGALKPIILTAVKEHGRLYGYEIARWVSQKTDSQITLTDGALYPMLHKLEVEGLMTVESESVNGRTRKYYSLTEEGITQSGMMVDELLIFMRAIVLLLRSPV